MIDMEPRDEIREKIDSLDQRILQALAERVSLAREIGQRKKRAGLSIIDVAREHAVLRRVIEKAGQLNLPEDGTEAVYREIMRLCRKVQMDQVRVGFLGPRGTFSEQAAREHFQDKNATFEERPTVSDIFRSVKTNEVNIGVVPIENSNEGSVVITLDLLSESNLMISGEIVLRVTHNLIVKPGTGLGDIVEVASHPQALAQCHHYLEENLPKAELLETKSTSAAVKLVAERDGVAAIGTELAAQIFGMHTIAFNIEDSQENHTRFFVLGKEDSPPTGRDRTSVLFSVQHRPGSLQEALEVLSKRTINLTKIESRPSRGKPWEYVFFCDFEGHRKDQNCREALEELQLKTVNLKVLGSYPRAQ